MAIRPEDFTSAEMRLICLAAMQARLGTEILGKLERVLAVANNTREGFFIGSYAGPAFEMQELDDTTGPRFRRRGD